MRNANKSNIFYSAVVREMENGSGICMRDWITTPIVN